MLHSEYEEWGDVTIDYTFDRGNQLVSGTIALCEAAEAVVGWLMGMYIDDVLLGETSKD